MQRQDFPSPIWQGSSTSYLPRSNSPHHWSPNRNQQLDLILFQRLQRPNLLLFYWCPFRNIRIPPPRSRKSTFRCPSLPTLGRTTATTSKHLWLHQANVNFLHQPKAAARNPGGYTSRTLVSRQALARSQEDISWMAKRRWEVLVRKSFLRIRNWHGGHKA